MENYYLNVIFIIFLIIESQPLSPFSIFFFGISSSLIFLIPYSLLLSLSSFLDYFFKCLNLIIKITESKVINKLDDGTNQNKVLLVNILNHLSKFIM